MDPPCRKRLEAMLPEWIDAWENQEKPIEPVFRYKLVKASSSWIEFSNPAKHRHPELSPMERSPR